VSKSVCVASWSWSHSSLRTCAPHRSQAPSRSKSARLYRAADDLGKTHDPAWFPLLREIADQHGDMYLSYAAESGGDAAIPAMLARLHSPDSNTREAAIYALGQTGSRAVIALLISLIGTEASKRNAAGMNVSLSANQALRQLTHFYAEEGSEDTLVPGWRRRWEQWWLTAGASAPIYRPGDCVADTPLP
jgi:hypothetical protein